MVKTSDKPRLGDPKNTLYLIDISAFIFRAFYAVRHLSNSQGTPTNAVFGVATMLAKLQEMVGPEKWAIVYDSKGPGFRHELYPEYKANRGAPPEDLIPQFDLIKTLIEKLKIPSFEQQGVEADDLIATLTHKWTGEDDQNRVVIVSSDKDLMQLLGDRVCMLDTMKEKVFGPEECEEKLGVPPHQVRDYLSLVGDTSDNVPGVPSIGPKSASALLQDYGNLEGVLEAASQGQVKGKKGVVLVEHKELALLSQKLVSLKEDCEVSWEKNQFDYRFQPNEEVLSFIESLEFKTLVQKWSKWANQTVPSQVQKLPPASVVFQSITDEKSLVQLVKQIEKKGQFAFDLETTSLNPREAKIVGLAFCLDSKIAYYVPVGHTGEGASTQLSDEWVMQQIQPLLENPKIKKIGQNLKYDWSVLQARGVYPSGIGADTMVASYLLDPTGKHNLDFLSQRYLGHTPISYESLCGKGKDQISFAQVSVKEATDYAAEDAWLAFELWKIFQKELQEQKLMEVFARIDLPMVEILTQMEMEGVHIDVSFLKELSIEFKKILEEIEKKINSYTKEPINLNSPKQLSHLLFEELGLPTQTKTKTGFSTDAKVLSILAPLHEVPQLLLEYREVSKLLGTYVDPLPQLIDSSTGKIHASFHQTVTATGRLSSSDPNLQNIPIRTERGKLIRRAFVPSNGNVLLSADYSQIELRILAHMSEDPSLMESFQKGEDVHKKTAADIYHIDTQEVTDSQRAVAKAINFGLMYGKTAFGLSQELGIPRGEASQMIQIYFERYAAVKAFLDQQIELTKERGWSMTLSGRKRVIPEIRSKNRMVQANGERMAMNTPIQGTAADLMKLAMIDLSEALERKGFRSKMIIQVHDEILLDCPKDEVEKVQPLVEKTLENAMKLKVPLKVNSSIGENWKALK